MFSDWKFPHLLSLLSILNFVPLPTVWTPPGFFFLPFPPPAVPMLCWERVGVKYTVPVRSALSLGSAWVGLVTLWIGGLTSGIPIRPYPSPHSPVHQMLISGNFRIPECYAVMILVFTAIRSVYQFLSFSLLFALHNWHLTKKVSSYSKFSFL